MGSFQITLHLIFFTSLKKIRMVKKLKIIFRSNNFIEIKLSKTITMRKNNTILFEKISIKVE